MSCTVVLSAEKATVTPLIRHTKDSLQAPSEACFLLVWRSHCSYTHCLQTGSKHTHVWIKHAPRMLEACPQVFLSWCRQLTPRAFWIVCAPLDFSSSSVTPRYKAGGEGVEGGEVNIASRGEFSYYRTDWINPFRNSGQFYHYHHSTSCLCAVLMAAFYLLMRKKLETPLSVWFEACMYSKHGEAGIECKSCVSVLF